MAKLPRSIQKEVDEAEAFERELAEQAQPVEAPESQALEEMPSKGDEALQEVQPIEPQADKTWEHKYRVLQTKYDAEVPRLYGQVRELTEDRNQLVQRLESPPPSDLEAPSALENKSLEGFRKEFGDDLVDGILGIATDVAERQVKLEAADSRQRLARLEVREQETSRDRFLSQLEGRVPNWNDINNEQGWLDWLNEYDPIVGATRQAALDFASKEQDVNRVAGIFSSYMLTSQRVQTPPPMAPSRAMQEQISPRGQGGSTGSTPTKRIYTQREAAELLSVSYGRRLSATENEALEKEMTLAYEENRVIDA